MAKHRLTESCGEKASDHDWRYEGTSDWYDCIVYRCFACDRRGLPVSRWVNGDQYVESWMMVKADSAVGNLLTEYMETPEKHSHRFRGNG